VSQLSRHVEHRALTLCGARVDAVVTRCIAVVCGERWFRSKYLMLGRFPDSWFGGRLPIEPSFHLDARDVVMDCAADTADAERRCDEFFRRQVRVSDRACVLPWPVM
jgi:hypothetical protein